jgi:hypothetical protein
MLRDIGATSFGGMKSHFLIDVGTARKTIQINFCDSRSTFR